MQKVLTCTNVKKSHKHNPQSLWYFNSSLQRIHLSPCHHNSWPGLLFSYSSEPSIGHNNEQIN